MKFQSKNQVIEIFIKFETKSNTLCRESPLKAYCSAPNLAPRFAVLHIKRPASLREYVNKNLKISSFFLTSDLHKPSYTYHADAIKSQFHLWSLRLVPRLRAHCIIGIVEAADGNASTNPFRIPTRSCHSFLSAILGVSYDEMAFCHRAAERSIASARATTVVK